MLKRWAIHCKCLLVIIAVVIQPGNSLTCIDEEGSAVDWYIVYKLPEHSADSGHLNDGTGYAYLDVNNPKFVISSNDVNSSSSAVYRTLKPIYDNYSNSLLTSGVATDDIIARGFYNDEWPGDGGTSSYRGHTKGARAFDSQGGFFLTHSVPRFPNYVESGYSYPSSGTNYGQNMMCISLNVSQFDKLGTHFLYTYPWSYNVSIPSQFQESVPNLVSAAVEANHVTEEPYTASETVVSSGGVEFTLFSKWKAADEDMLSEMMAPKLKSDLFSQTWQNSGTNLPSDCQDTYWTFTVEEMSFTDFDIQFSTNKDHSKWAVGPPTGYKNPSDWVCIGDMNRQESQEDRSGGYTCFQETTVSQQYVNITAALLNCTSTKRTQSGTSSFDQNSWTMSFALWLHKIVVTNFGSTIGSAF